MKDRLKYKIWEIKTNKIDKMFFNIKKLIYKLENKKSKK